MSRCKSTNGLSVAVVVPTHTTDLGWEQRLSLRFLERYLEEYHKVLVVPEGETSIDGFEVKRFPSHHFESRRAMNRLMLSAEFYSAFDEYSHILIYQTDALVFSNQLLDWCRRGYDYVGAPWPDTSPFSLHGRSERCGNGGFSLRKVRSCLRALETATTSVSARRLYGSLGRDPLKLTAKRLLKPTAFLPDLFPGNEDRWWSLHAPYFDPDFRVAPADVAVAFSFETFPSNCFRENEGRLPFGCHAWRRYEPEFWQAQIEELRPRAGR